MTKGTQMAIDEHAMAQYAYEAYCHALLRGADRTASGTLPRPWSALSEKEKDAWLAATCLILDLHSGAVLA